MEHEYHWMPRLAPLLPVATPVLLGKGTSSEGYPLPWSVYRWLEGQNPKPGHFTAPDLLAQELAKFVSALQRIDPTDAPPGYRGGPLATRDAELRAAVTNLTGDINTAAGFAAQ